MEGNLKFPQDALVDGEHDEERRLRSAAPPEPVFRMAEGEDQAGTAPRVRSSIGSISVERRARAAGGMPFAHVANQVPAGQ